VSLITKITGIPHDALNGTPFSQFSVNKRLRWKDDKRLMDEVYKLERCIRDIYPFSTGLDIGVTVVFLEPCGGFMYFLGVAIHQKPSID
jgi:hypothetical protein